MSASYRPSHWLLSTYDHGENSRGPLLSVGCCTPRIAGLSALFDRCPIVTYTCKSVEERVAGALRAPNRACFEFTADVRLRLPAPFTHNLPKARPGQG